MKAKIYLSAAWCHQQRMIDVRNRLDALHLFVTSRWLYHTEAKEPASATIAAIQDLNDIRSSDVMFFFAENASAGYMTGGRHVEVGYALCLGIPVIVIGQAENVFHHLPQVRVVASLNDAIKLII